MPPHLFSISDNAYSNMLVGSYMRFFYIAAIISIIIVVVIIIIIIVVIIFPVSSHRNLTDRVLLVCRVVQWHRYTRQYYAAVM